MGTGQEVRTGAGHRGITSVIQTQFSLVGMGQGVRTCMNTCLLHLMM